MLIALEGPKLAGKSTLMSALAEHPACAGWVFAKLPSPDFNLAHEQQLHGVDLFAAIAADRNRVVDDVVVPALTAGRTVVIDRYLLSGYVFHRIDGVTDAVIEAQSQPLPLPGRMFLVLAPPAALTARRRARATARRLQSQITPQEEISAYLSIPPQLWAVPYETLWNETDECLPLSITKILAAAA